MDTAERAATLTPELGVLERLSKPPTFQGVTKRFEQDELAMEEVLRD